MPKSKTLPMTGVTTKHRIGKTTYLVTASPSEKATDTLGKKVEKLIRKDMTQNAQTEPSPVQEQ